VSGFRLDKYLVTVGRFRQFVLAWKGGWLPAAGSGKHTHLNEGNGLSATGGGYEPGWVASDDANVTPTDANLTCKDSFDTWTSTAGTHEDLPINCVTWQEAYAFCIWDGGFLPSEAEWEYAAAGGAEQRAYPWGPTDPGKDNQYAVDACYFPSGAGTCVGVANIAPVGTATAGAGRWGQLDLAGDLWEWTADSYAPDYVDPCADCAHLAAAIFRVFRGGNFNSGTSYLRPPYRFYYPPTFRDYGVGLRCARSP
jgi:formylglycine-generating enzyme required for sulfatase activity